MEEHIGKPLLNETREQQIERVQKAMKHEKSFKRERDTDLIKKRMDSDLFKSRNLGEWT